ncbi:MAG: cation:dicarboxylase symporter family transporter, partial [Bdellovibrionales bacterium]|nr:cation:dicarboxylase symporter family transporter [Bdellovibrionales bacterium]
MLQSLLILFGLVAGALTGHLVFDPNWTQQQPLTEHAAAGLLQFCHFIGFTVFIGLLKMLIVPLVATSVVVGILSVGDFQKLGKLGFWTVVYYLVTMLLAVLTGLLLVNVLEPGRALAGAHALPSAVDSLDAAGRARADAGVMGVCIHLIEMLIPENVFASMAAGDTLSVIAFFIFFAVVASSLGSKAEPVTQFAEALFQILMKMVQIVLWLAPLGVWALLCWSVARVGLGVFGESIGQFMITVLLGLVIHGVVTLPL